MPDYQSQPFYIRIFVPTGNPDGLRIVEKSNWSGVVLRVQIPSKTKLILRKFRW